MLLVSPLTIVVISSPIILKCKNIILHYIRFLDEHMIYPYFRTFFQNSIFKFLKNTDRNKTFRPYILYMFVPTCFSIDSYTDMFCENSRVLLVPFPRTMFWYVWKKRPLKNIISVSFGFNFTKQFDKFKWSTFIYFLIYLSIYVIWSGAPER